jgi:hypothetical protein
MTMPSLFSPRLFPRSMPLNLGRPMLMAAALTAASVAALGQRSANPTPVQGSTVQSAPGQAGAGQQQGAAARTTPANGGKVASVPGTAPAQPGVAQPQTPPNLLDQPASPATVTEASGSLAVKADNSSLSDILHQVASKTGMKLDGLTGDERVFGTFGPGDPHDVLNSLLDGTSYNVLMVGDLANGAPRELLLTRKSGGPAPAPQPNAQPNPAQDEDPSADDGPPPDEMRPGDIVEREQEMERMQRENNPDGSNNPDNGQPGQHPRTPAEMLQQMRNQPPSLDQQQPPQ